MNFTSKFLPTPPKQTNQFREFWDLGYRRLIPVVPPGAPVSEQSYLAKAAAAGKDPRGKSPGERGADGKWHGLKDWLNVVATEADLDLWHSWGANVGLLMGADGVHLIDADALDLAQSSLIQMEAFKCAGVLPTRVGAWPKMGYLVRVSGPLPYRRIDYGDKGERVEILGVGRQAVVAGVHAKTLKIYTWVFPLVPLDKLPVVSPQQLIDLLATLATMLPKAKIAKTEGGAAVAQASLRGSLDAVRKAVAATPNTTAAFPTRDDYVEYGYAIKASLPDNPSEAFEIFSEWSERWADGTNAPEVISKEWSGMKPPFRRGASWLFELAEQHAPDQFRKVDAFFDILPDEPESLFTALPAPKSSAPEVEPLVIIDPTTWSGRPIPPREWVVDGWVPRNEVTLLYGDGGVGKSLLTMQFATCAATGRSWLGQATRPSRVMGFFCEDSEDEMLRRQVDINRALGVEFAELTGLRLICRKHSDNVFALWDRQTGALKLQPVWHQLVTAAREFRADVVIVDTIADVYAGSEIDRAQVNAFVKGVLGRLGKEIGGTVLALGHPSVSGKQSGEGTSGSTAWNNAVRSRLYLKHPKTTDSGNTRVLEGRKTNYGPKGAQLIIRYSRGAFETIAGTQPTTQGVGATAPPDIVSIGEAAERAVVSVLMAYPNERLSLAANSQYYAVKVLRGLDPDGLAPFTDDKVLSAIRSLERRGAIREQRIGSTEHGRAIHGYVVLPDKIAAPPIAAEEPLQQIAQLFD